MTIVKKVLKKLEQAPMKRKDVVLYIKSLNGTTYKGTEGYYNQAFLRWDQEGLIKREKGVYSITEFGKDYIVDPSILRKRNKKKHDERNKERSSRRLNELKNTTFELKNCVRELQWDIDRMSGSGREVYNHLRVIASKLSFLTEEIKELKIYR
jgi:hypothetical protein